MKNLFRVNIFTYIFLILSMLSGYLREMFIIFIILIIHELGHFFLMKINSIEVKSITIYPYGGMIKSNMLINTNSMSVLFISLAGIISQILLWLIFLIVFKIGFINEYYYEIFYKYNLYIILFNLIPIYPLDGFKILNSILELIFSFKKSVIISLSISIMFLILFILYLYIYKVSNYIIILFLLISFLNYIKELKYLFNKFYIERVLYDLKYNGIVSINSISDIYKNKYNYIGYIDEKKYLNKMFNN